MSMLTNQFSYLLWCRKVVLSLYISYNLQTSNASRREGPLFSYVHPLRKLSVEILKLLKQLHFNPDLWNVKMYIQSRLPSYFIQNKRFFH